MHDTLCNAASSMKPICYNY